MSEPDAPPGTAEVDTAPTSGGPAIALVLLALLPLSAMIGWAAPRGFDRTDDGYYLGSIAHPADVTTDLLAFGSVYHPVFLAVGGDVTALRVVGALLTVAVGAAFAWVVLGTPSLLAGGRTPRPLARAAVAVALGATGLLTQTGLPATPSYNSLNLQALLGIATGLVLALTRPRPAAYAGWVLVGVAGWVGFLAKPTSAAIAAGLVGLAVAAAPGRRGGVWAAPLAIVAAAALTMLAYRQTPAELVARTRAGIESANALGGHEALLRWDPLPHRLLLVLPVVALAVFVAVGCALLRPRGLRTLLVLPLAAGSAGFVAVAGVRWGRAVGADQLARDGGFVVAGLALSALVLVVLAHGFAHGMARRGRRAVVADEFGASPSAAPVSAAVASPVSTAFLLLALVLLPVAAAFGTNGNLWAATGKAAVLVLVPLTARLVGTAGSLWVAPALTAVLVITPLQVAAAASPYRYPPLTEATSPTDLGPAGTLLLTPQDSGQARATVELGKRVGVRDRFVIDLTGASPGTVFLMGGRPVGEVWVFGGYPGTADVARRSFRAARCAALGAFVLDDPSAPRRIDPAVLDVLGRDRARDYEQVGSVPYYRASFRGRPVAPEARAVLLRPTVPPDPACG